MVPYTSWIYFQLTSTCTVFEIRGQSPGYSSIIYQRFSDPCRSRLLQGSNLFGNRAWSGVPGLSGWTWSFRIVLPATPGPVSSPLTYVSFSSCCSSQWICVKVFHCTPGILSQITSWQRYLLLEETLFASRFQWRRLEQDREARFETKEVKTDSPVLIFGGSHGWLHFYVCLIFEPTELLHTLLFLELALWLSCKTKLPLFILTPCLLADQHAPAGLAELILLLHYTSLWIRSLHHLWPSNRNPAFWNILPRYSFLSWRNSWTTGRAILAPGIYLISLKPFISLFLTYKFLLRFLWKTALRSTTLLELELWSLLLQPRQKKKIPSWRVLFNICIVFAHLLTDLRAPLLFSGYGSITSILCKASLWNSQKYKHFSIFLNSGIYGYTCPCYTDCEKDALNTQPSWLGVCVYLLKRSKTCIISGWWISCWRTIDWITFTLWSSFTRFAVQYETIWHVTAGKHFVAGGQSSSMLLCPTKLCIKEGSQGWPPWCTCYMIEFDMVILLKHWSWGLGVLFSSCLLHHHETRNIFCHDFGTWCLSFC